ncbi:MAG TPA: Na+/H+ antiporter NhaA [Kofleriaceae bacterium]|nr:Na+/H+ antiporter NhaA [Kofleriaceae bacterium]
MSRFIKQLLAIEAASGIALLAATAAALIWANVWSDSYTELEHSVHFWINDGLMSVFFFVVGLEIRREIRDGELATLKKAALPVVAAVGGMLVPAAIFATLNSGRAGSAGWAIPMATDIAFAVGVLTLLGSRVPSSLRVLLLALAVIDDIGAIAVIVSFYAGGIHPAIVGVVLGLLLPSQRLRERLIHVLHPFNAFVVMPLFALSNAGVVFGGAQFSGDYLWLFVGVVAGLAIGKPVGIAAASLGVGRRGVLLVGFVGGIGFTMSLFIAQLAFPAGPLLDTAKLAILVGSGTSMLVGLAYGFVTQRRG